MKRFTFPAMASAFALLFLFGSMWFIPVPAQALQLPPAADMDFGAHAFFDAVKEGANLGVNGILIAMLILVLIVVVQLDRRQQRDRAKEEAARALERSNERKDADAKHAELLSHHNAFVATMVAERASIQTERISMQTTLIGMVREQISQSIKTEETMRNLATELHDFREALNSLTVAIGQLRKG